MAEKLCPETFSKSVFGFGSLSRDFVALITVDLWQVYCALSLEYIQYTQDRRHSFSYSNPRVVGK